MNRLHLVLHKDSNKMVCFFTLLCNWLASLSYSINSFWIKLLERSFLLDAPSMFSFNKFRYWNNVGSDDILQNFTTKDTNELKEIVP
jgi:hypothetical protein